MKHPASSDQLRGKGQASLIAHAVFLIGALATLALPTASQAQGKYTWESYEERVSKANDVVAYGTDMFGEQVSLQNGALSFRVTDVSLPGNNGLEVAFTRTYSVKNTQTLASNRLLADWEVELPRITGTFADAWLAANTSTARCSGVFRTFQPGGSGPVGPAIQSIRFGADGKVTVRYAEAETGSRIKRVETIDLKKR